MRTARNPIVAAALVALGALAGCGEEIEPIPEPVVTKGKIAGTISSAGAPLAGATVGTDPATVTALTGADGKFTLEVPVATYKVVATAAGFATKERAGVAVAENATVTLDFALEKSASPMGDVKVVVGDACNANAPLAGATVTMVTGADGVAIVDMLAPGSYTFEVNASGFLPKEVTAEVVADQTATVEVNLDCQSRVAADAARAFLARTKGTGAFNPIMTADKLYELLYTTTETTDNPKVLSVRSPMDYVAGHVPTATNIAWTEIADDDMLAKLGAPTLDGPGILDYCYTGHTGGIASALLNMMGYKAANLKYGLVSWTQDAAARVAGVGVTPTQSNDYELETTVNAGEATHTPPTLAVAGARTAFDVVKGAARAYLKNPTMKATIEATALHDLLNDSDPANDPFIISVRKPDHYARGHIKGAVNIPWQDIALEENLKKIPTDRDIVVYCYTGHTGAIATGVLGALGYHRVKNLKFGLQSWTQDGNVLGTTDATPVTIWSANEENDYPIVTGKSAGSLQ